MAIGEPFVIKESNNSIKLIVKQLGKVSEIENVIQWYIIYILLRYQLKKCNQFIVFFIQIFNWK